jgi:hypothetical protein
MKFLLLLYGDEAAELALSPEEQRAIVDRHMTFSRELGERGPFLGGEGLAPSQKAVVVRRRGVTDGPYIETKEQLGGYYLVECADRDAAIELARGVPDSPGLAIEVRPIMS